METLRWLKRKIAFRKLGAQMRNTWVAGGTVTLRALDGPRCGMYLILALIFFPPRRGKKKQERN